MKQIKHLLTGVMTCVVALALATPALAQSAKTRTGKIVRIKGAARYSADNGVTWTPLKVGDEMKAGALVQTAKDSYMDLVIGDPNEPAPKPAAPGAQMDYSPVAQRDAIRVMPDTTLAFDKLTQSKPGNGETVTETQCDLRQGKLFFTVRKMSNGSRFEIKIPNGVAGIRGTIGMVSSDGVMAILAGSGVLAYSKADGTLLTQVVPGGYIFDARSNELTRMAKTMEADLQRMSQQCYFPGPPPPHPRPPVVHHSPHKPGNNGNGNGNGPPPPPP